MNWKEAATRGKYRCKQCVLKFPFPDMSRVTDGKLSFYFLF